MDGGLILRNNAIDSKDCNLTRETVNTKVLYSKLAEAEEEIANATEGEDFFEVAKQLRDSIHAH